MTRIFLLSIIFLGLSEVCFSQSHIQKLQGPKAKNNKPWQRKEKTFYGLYTRVKPKVTKGPRAKNAKPGSQKYRNALQPIGRRKIELKGLKAKNYKPWRKENLSSRTKKK